MCNCEIIPQHIRPTPSQVGIVDRDFSPEEHLYRRVDPDVVLDDIPENRDLAIIDQIEDISCFRSKYCDNPSDALYDDFHCRHLPDHQIIRYNVGVVENGFSHRRVDDSTIIYSVAIRHDPTPCIYSHCEIKNFESKEDFTEVGEEFALPSGIVSQVQERDLFTKAAKTAYRVFLVNNFDIIKRATP